MLTLIVASVMLGQWSYDGFCEDKPVVVVKPEVVVTPEVVSTQYGVDANGTYWCLDTQGNKFFGKDWKSVYETAQGVQQMQGTATVYVQYKQRQFVTRSCTTGTCR